MGLFRRCDEPSALRRLNDELAPSIGLSPQTHLKKVLDLTAFNGFVFAILKIPRLPPNDDGVPRDAVC
jgi:hypothetical protein